MRVSLVGVCWEASSVSVLDMSDSHRGHWLFAIVRGSELGDCV
jgi:hypothetical protein